MTFNQWCRRGGTGVPPNIFWENAIPPNDIRTRGKGDTVVFHQVGLQRNAKSMVTVNSSFHHLGVQTVYIYSNDKMLSYRRETALQGAL